MRNSNFSAARNLICAKIRRIEVRYLRLKKLFLNYKKNKNEIRFEIFKKCGIKDCDGCCGLKNAELKFANLWKIRKH